MLGAEERLEYKLQAADSQRFIALRNAFLTLDPNR